MKIAIDVHSLGTQAGGNETYYRQLVRGLAEDRGENRYTLFHTHPFTLEAIQNDSRFSLCKIPKNPILRLSLGIPAKLRQIRPDVFHCQYIQPPWGTGKTVVTIHDLAHEHFPEFFHPMEALRMKKLVRWTARRADHILTVSEFSASDIAERFALPRSKISVAYQSAASDFHPRNKEACQEHLARKYGINSPFILYVGRIQARKNLLRLVDAYALVRKKGASVQLVIVGRRDWQSELLLAKIREIGLESSVVFPGFVSFNDLPLFYNAAESFVFPSLFEGFGLPVMEGMASGVPTITSFGSALAEVAGDGAMLIDPQNTASIATAIERLLSDPAMQRDLVARGLQRSAAFPPGQLVQKTLDVYHALI
ncbi:MAG TPA: glycosyltransferase family 1 protein [Candidatus Angelobacter sp.]|nr:glycosyltransferase family 1 protein [Candidatus Angelobacter sp.]